MRSSRGSSSGSSSRWLAPGVAVAVVVGGLSWTLPAAAQPAAEEASPGQKDLDAAFDAKLAADDIDDYANVLDLCRRAIAKGLSEDQKRFAEDLYTDTLMYRAARVVQAIYNVERPDRQWPRLRLFAMRDLGEVVERNPGLGEAQLMIAQLESMPGGDRERAGAAARKALELLPDDRLQSARAHALLGTLSDDRAEQLSHYDKAVELAPGDKDIRRARGLFHLLEEKFDEARVDLESAIAADPEDASLQEALGLALMMDEKLDEAQEAFDRALELEPDSASALLQRARLRALRGDRPEAIADLDKAIGIAPDEALLLVLRARIHQQAGDSARAAADLERVLEKTPDHPAALELRGLIAADRQDYDAAIRDFRRLVSQRQDDVVLVSQLGMLYLMAKQPRQAIRRFSRGLEIDENNFPCRRGRSDAEISIGDHAAALADLEKALELEPDDPGVLNNLAWLLATSPDEAVRDGKRAIELATKACEATEWKQPHIVSTLAAGYAEAGDFETARKYSQRAVDAEGTAAEVRQQLEGELASYREGKPWRERQQQEERLPAAGPVEDDGPQKGPDAREEGGRDEDASPPPARDKGPTRRPFD